MASEREYATTSGSSWVEKVWESFRCRTCNKLLFKVTPEALKPGEALEIKCGCKTMNYLMGPRR